MVWAPPPVAGEAKVKWAAYLQPVRVVIVSVRHVITKNHTLSVSHVIRKCVQTAAQK